MKILTVLFFLIFSVSAQAEIYKTVDESGNVIYTDMKPKDSESEEVKLKPITPIENVPARNSVPASKAPKESGESEYYFDFKIIEPQNEATIRNKQRFSVQVSIQPRLLRSHRIRLLLDGEIVETKRETLFTLENVERGAHTITAELLDARRKVIKSSSNTIYVHRTIFSPPQKTAGHKTRFGFTPLKT